MTYSTTQESIDDTLSSIKSSRTPEENFSAFTTAVSAEEKRKLERAVSDGVQVSEEMCDEEVQTAQSEVHTEEVQTVDAEPRVNCEEIQTIEMQPEITRAVQTDDDDKHTTEAQTAGDNRSTQGTLAPELLCIPKDQPQEETSDGDQELDDTADRENFSGAESVPAAATREDCDHPQSLYSQLQRIGRQCEHEDELLHVEIAMCEAMERAAKFRELMKNSRSLAERERLNRKATELETIVAETAALYESGRKSGFGVLKKMDQARNLPPAFKEASSQSEESRLVEEAADVERLVTEAVAICRTKAEAARLREAGACAESPEERKCLERAAADREALVEKLERSATERRKSEARRVINEAAAFRKAVKAADSADEEARSEREAYERETPVSDNSSIHKSQIEAAGLRKAEKSAKGPEDSYCIERSAVEREPVLNIVGTSSPSSRDFTSSSLVRQGTRRPASKKDSHGPKRNNKLSSVDFYSDSLRNEHLPRRLDQRSFSVNDALLNQIGHEEFAKKCPTELPAQQLSHLGSSLSAICLMTLIPVGFKENNPCETNQSHPVAIERSDSGKALAEAHRLDGSEQLNQVSRSLPVVTKRQCRAFAEWKRQECVVSRTTDVPTLSNLPRREVKTITHPTSSSSVRSLPCRILDSNNELIEHPLYMTDSGALLKHGHNMPARMESVGVNTEPESCCKTVDSGPTFVDPLLEDERMSEPQDPPQDSIPEGNAISSSGPDGEEPCIPVLGFENGVSLSLALQKDQNQKDGGLSTTGGISSTSLLSISHESGSEKNDLTIATGTGASLQVAAEHLPKAVEAKFLEAVDQASSKSQRSNSYNSKSEDNVLHETADVVSACSGERSKLSCPALLNIVEEARYQKCGEFNDEALEGREVVVEKSLESGLTSSQDSPEQTQELAAEGIVKRRVSRASQADVLSEQTEPDIKDSVDSEEASTASKEKSEIFFDSTSGTSPSRQSAYASMGSSSSVNIPADCPASRENFQGQENQKTRTISLFSDTSRSGFSTRKKDPPDQVPEVNKSVRQSSSVMSFPVVRYPTRMAQSSKSEHDLVVEDVILAVEATARHAARAAAARDRAFEAAGVAVRAVASEDVAAARRAVQSSRAAAEVAVEQAACAARESIKASSLATTSKCSRRASSLATASALAAQQDSLAAERFFSHAADALQCLEFSDSATSDERLAAATFKQVVTSSVLTNDAAAKARVHLAEAASAAQAVERIVADPSRTDENITQLEQAAAVAASEAARAAAEANAEAEAVARACLRARRIASASCRSAFAASAARHSSTSADSAKIKAAAASEAASAAKTYAQQASDAAAVIAFSTVSETARMAAYSAALVAAAKTAAARSASECSQAKAAASEAAAQIAACIPADCLCISLTESTKLEAFALAKTAEAEAAASRAAEKAGNAASHAATALAVSLNVQELVARDEAAAVAVRYAAAAAREATRLADAAAEDAEAASNEASVCRHAAASFHLPPRLSAGSVVQIKSASQCSFETERRSSFSQASRARLSISQSGPLEPPL